jgi:flagellar protein FliO/FliZ
MNQSIFTAMLPALGLLLVMALLAWGVHWVRKRMSPVGSGLGADLRLVSQLMVGPQQRVVVVEVHGPTGPVQLTLGVTPQHISALYVQGLDAPGLLATAPAAMPAAASPEAFAAAVPAAPSPAAPETLYQKLARSLNRPAPAEPRR